MTNEQAATDLQCYALTMEHQVQHGKNNAQAFSLRLNVNMGNADENRKARAYWRGYADRAQAELDRINASLKALTNA